MKQQAALNSFGAHNRNVLRCHAMKQVLEVMEPPTVVFYRFLMASIGRCHPCC